jgi:hypothetical protein
MAQQRLDHVTMAVFDRGDERSDTVLVCRENEKKQRGNA